MNEGKEADRFSTIDPIRIACDVRSRLPLPLPLRELADLLADLAWNQLNPHMASRSAEEKDE